MQKEKIQQVNLKNQEVSKMSTANIPYNNKQLLKWSCFRVEKSEDYKKSYELIHTPLTELVNQKGYERFKDRLNWLYNNYSANNYKLVWSELQDYNERRKIQYIQDTLIARAEYIFNQKVEEAKYEFGEIPAWIDKLNDKQRDLLLARARTCYGLEPKEVVLETKQVYTLPKQIIKEFRDDGSAVYYSQEELNKAGFTDNYLTDIVGRVKVKVLQRLAENAVIRDAHWMSKFNDTEFDLREHREVEGDANGNRLVPITDLQGDNKPFEIVDEFRDFLEPIYGDEDGWC